MRGDKELKRSFQPFIGECEPTTDQVRTARERLEASIAEDAAGRPERAEKAIGPDHRPGSVRTPRRAINRLSASLAQLVAGLVVVVAVLPTGGADTFPGHCSTILGYTVPCGPWLALGAGAATAVLVRLLMRRR